MNTLLPHIRTFLLIAAVAVCLPALAQEQGKKTPKPSKKLQMMLDWQEEQEKKEAYNKVVEEAHRLFQQDQYEQAQQRYRDALEIIPNDQVAIAKITDIQLVMDSIALADPPVNVAATNTETTTVAAPLPPAPEPVNTPTPSTPARNVAIETAEPAPERPPKSLEELLRNLPIRRPDITGLADSQPVKPRASEPVTSTAPIASAPKPASPKPAPARRLETIDKSSPEFQTELAKNYDAGWTVEEITEGGKHIVKKVYVADNKGTEYLRIQHSWGGLYFFRNGTPITENTWQTETLAADK